MSERLPSTPTAAPPSVPWPNWAAPWTNCPGALGVLVAAGVPVGVLVGVFVGVGVLVAVAVGVAVGLPLPKETVTPLTAGEAALVPRTVGWDCRYPPPRVA